MIEGMPTHDPDPRARKRQTLTYSAWAILEVLAEHRASALAEMMFAFRSGKPVERHAAKLTVLDELESDFRANFTKEQQQHDA